MYLFLFFLRSLIAIVALIGSSEGFEVRFAPLNPRGLIACLQNEDGVESFSFYGSAYRTKTSRVETYEGQVMSPKNGLWCYVKNKTTLRVGDNLNYWYRVIQSGKEIQSEYLSSILKEDDFKTKSQFLNEEQPSVAAIGSAPTPEAAVPVANTDNIGDIFVPQEELDAVFGPQSGEIPALGSVAAAEDNESLFNQTVFQEIKPQYDPLLREHFFENVTVKNRPCKKMLELEKSFSKVVEEKYGDLIAHLNELELNISNMANDLNLYKLLNKNAIEEIVSFNFDRTNKLVLEIYKLPEFFRTVLNDVIKNTIGIRDYDILESSLVNKKVTFELKNYRQKMNIYLASKTKLQNTRYKMYDFDKL